MKNILEKSKYVRLGRNGGLELNDIENQIFVKNGKKNSSKKLYFNCCVLLWLELKYPV